MFESNLEWFDFFLRYTCKGFIFICLFFDKCDFCENTVGFVRQKSKYFWESFLDQRKAKIYACRNLKKFKFLYKGGSSKGS